MERAINRQNLGAWLLRCNPEGIWDLPAFINDGGDLIDDWSVVKNYRSAMMAPGDRVLFWVAGNGRQMTRGIWGIGHITGYVQDRIPRSSDHAGYWRSEKARLAVTNSVDVHIPLLKAPITDVSLKAAGIDYLEVQRQPQGSNPSWVSKKQLARLDRLLPGWPTAPDEKAEITVDPKGGAGFGSPALNKIVEDAAMAAVRQFYEAGDWDVDDVSDQKVGWDFTCTSPYGETAHVEVKGVQGHRPIVLLTANELRAAKGTKGWVLAVVTRALTDPAVDEFTPRTVLAAAEPYVYRVPLAP